MKLSDSQKQAIEWMKKYPKDMVMFNGWMTGGHGVRIKLNTVRSLQRLGLIESGKLTKEAKKLTDLKCQSCKKNWSQSEHTCPFSSEINGDNEYKCNCCDECCHECCMSI